ncbi:hypothetical protein QCA50_019179 [Cerrena zonata]|uniref:Uncharacterized protein n=1 Tax=Cerrena zonata TaxID=2478898 RepID=A0AAW0FF68_9APHY
MLVSSQSLLNLHELEDSLNVLDVNPSLRGNVKSAIKRAGTIVKNKRRPSVVQQSVDEPATFPQGEPTEKESLADALTPRPTPDIPSICVQDLGEISPNPELGTTPRLGTSQRSLTPNHAIMHSAYPYLLNPYDNANISATSLLAVCGSPAPAFQEHNNNNTTLHPTVRVMEPLPLHAHPSTLPNPLVRTRRSMYHPLPNVHREVHTFNCEYPGSEFTCPWAQEVCPLGPLCVLSCGDLCVSVDYDDAVGSEGGWDADGGCGCEGVVGVEGFC